MEKIKDYIKKYKKGISLTLILSSVFSLGLYKALKTNVKQVGKTFIVSNRDIGKGYVFIYNAEESGWEYLVEKRGEYHIFVETGKTGEEIKEVTTHIRFNNLGKKHPLSYKLMYSDYFLDNIPFGRDGKIDVGEEILDRTRRKYQDKIPFQKILDKIKD